MSDNENKGLCPSCAQAIWCPIWAQYKCRIKERYITGRKATCASYEKQPKDFKEPKCQCEDCLKNAELTGEGEE